MLAFVPNEFEGNIKKSGKAQDFKARKTLMGFLAEAFSILTD